MYRNKSVLIALSLLLLCLFATPVAVGAEQIELTIWHHWTAHRVEYVQTLLDAFMENNPDIKVEQRVAGTGGAQNQLTAYIVSGTAPEIVMVSSGYSFPFMLQGGLYPLNDLIARDGVDLDAFIPADIESFQLRGETYGLPVTSGAAWTNLVFFNKDLMAEAGLAGVAPATWNEWREASLRLTRRDETGAPIVAGTNTPSMRQAVAWTGQLPWSEDWRHATVDTPRMHETVEMLLEVTESVYGSHQTQRSFMNSAISRFQNQQLGMWFINNSAFGFIDTYDFEWGAGLAPVNDKYPGSLPVGYVSGTWAYAIPATIDPEKVEATWKLLKFLTTEEDAAGWFTRVQKRPSPVMAFNGHPDYRVDNPYWDVVIQAVTYDVTTPPEVGDILGTYHTQILNRDIQPFQGLSDAHRAVQRALDEYWDAVGN